MRPRPILAADLLPALPAWAEVGDCSAPGYLAAFAEAPTARDLTCVELFRFEVPTPEGPRLIRSIADAAADWAVPSALKAEVERGARLAGLAGPCRCAMPAPATGCRRCYRCAACPTW